MIPVALFLSGCDDALSTAQATDKPPSTAVSEPSATPTPALPATPLSLAELAKVIDLRTFPRLPGKDVNEPRATRIGYEVEAGDLEKTLAFQRDALSKGGGKIVSDQLEKQYKYGSLVAEKDSCTLEVSVVEDPNSKRVNVFISNMGNVDARLLPRDESWTAKLSSYRRAEYLAKKNLQELADLIRAELTKQSWQEVVPYGGEDPSRVEGKIEPLWFLQKASQIGVNLEAGDAGTLVTYNVHVLQTELPIHPDVKGKIEFMDSPSYLTYAVTAGAEKVRTDLERELKVLGWSMGEGVKVESELKVMSYPLTQQGAKPLKLSIIGADQGKRSVVLFNGINDQ